MRTPEANADAGSGATRAARTLLGRCARDARKLEPVDADARVETEHARKAAVDDGRNVLDGHRRFGDVGCEHDLAARSSPQHRVLLLGRKISVEIRHVYPASR